MASDLSMGNGLWTLVGCCIFVGFTFAWHKVRRWGAATMHDGVECQTMANHKGGVGKTTVSLLLAKQLAADPAQNVLVVDCSLYGDISRLLLGDAGARVARGDADHIEGLAARLTRTGLCGRLWRRRPTVEQFVRKVEGAEHGNLFVLTSKAQCSNSILGTEECMAGLGAPLVARSLRDMLARDAARSGKPWRLVADTDGGLTHGMTRLALCLADSVTVPVNADVADIRRLRVLLNLMQDLRSRGQCVAEVTGAFFNQVAVKNNVPSAAAAACGLGFTPQEAVLKTVREVEAWFGSLRVEFPALLSGLAPAGQAGKAAAAAGGLDTPPAKAFFSAVRAGGTSLEKLKGDHAAAFDNASFEQDVDRLAKKLF